MIEKLLHFLADQRPHTSAALARHLGCKENCVRAQLAKLYGIVPLIETAGGWQIRPPLELLDPACLCAACPQAAVTVLAVTDSTNSVLARQKMRQSGDAVLAEYQSAGRGRRGRSWQAPFAGQIILSMYWHYPDPRDVGALSISLGIAAATVLRTVGYPVQLKWPNDLYLYGRKLGGILLETAVNTHGADTIAGIGINLLPPGGIEPPPASLSEHGNVVRNHLAAALINQWRSAFATHPANRDNLPARWQALDIYADCAVTLHAAQENRSGTNRGIDNQGRLRLEAADGSISYWTEGETGLRPQPAPSPHRS